MTETQGIVAVVAGVLGYALQWLRGFKWFNDGVTLFVCLVGGLVAAWLGGAAPPARDFWFAGLQNTLTIMGGTLLGHMAAQVKSPVMMAPKYDSLSK